MAIANIFENVKSNKNIF